MADSVQRFAQAPVAVLRRGLGVPNKGARLLRAPFTVALYRAWRRSTLVLFLGLCACSSPDRSSTLTIAAAANLQYALREIAAAYTAETGTDCQLVVASSGKLTAQISEGAPFDVFLSADEQYPAKLYAGGFSAAAPLTFARGRLALWSAHDESEPALDQLTNEQIRSIALANPRTAPYGIAAVETLQYYSLYDSVAQKLVYGESVAQASQFVLSQVAEVGFTAAAIVLSPELKGDHRWTVIDTAAYAALWHAGVVLNGQPAKQATGEDFLQFLLAEKSREILTKYGYLTP